MTDEQIKFLTEQLFGPLMTGPAVQQRVRDAMTALATQHPSQSAGEPVAYLDIGVGGYLDLGSDLTDEQLSALPKGRHMLGIIGTYGADGYAPSPPPTDAARASGVPVIKYGPLYEYAENRGLDYNELCSLVRSVVSCRTMKDQTK